MPEVTIDSPVGPLRLVSDGSALTGLFFQEEGGAAGSPDGVLREALGQLEDWFAGRRRDFDLPIAPQGTDFQKRVWTELQRIPYGETLSYGELARRLGNPGASRAVGLANGRNPLSIVIPCHRVVGADRRLVGYGGGLERKAWLLEHEARSLVALAP